METLKDHGKYNQGQRGLREQIEKSLETSPLAESRSMLDKEADE